MANSKYVQRYLTGYDNRVKDICEKVGSSIIMSYENKVMKLMKSDQNRSLIFHMSVSDKAVLEHESGYKNFIDSIILNAKLKGYLLGIKKYEPYISGNKITLRITLYQDFLKEEFLEFMYVPGVEEYVEYQNKKYSLGNYWKHRFSNRSIKKNL